MKPLHIAALVAVGAGVLLLFKRGSNANDALSAIRNDAAGPRLPAMPEMPRMPTMPGMPRMPTMPGMPRMPAVSGAAPNMPGPPAGMFSGMWG